MGAYCLVTCKIFSAKNHFFNTFRFYKLQEKNCKNIKDLK